MSLGVGVIIFLLLASTSHSYWNSLQISPPTLRHDYDLMASTFKIFCYTVPSCGSSSLTEWIRNSAFLTNDPHRAHLFFIPCPCTSHSPRSLSLLIHHLRSNYPFWNRTLGADHFCVGSMDFHSDRNLLELKTNSIHLSSFPCLHHYFVPHKDIALPPFSRNDAPPFNNVSTRSGFGYAMHGAVTNYLPSLREIGFVIDSEGAAEDTVMKNLASSEYCAFEYGLGVDFSRLGHALRAGCVPVIISERPIQSLPMVDIIRWSEIAVFVKAGSDLRGTLRRVLASGACDAMRMVGAEAARFFSWHQPPQRYDAFHMLMYQLWLRRHAIQYANPTCTL